MAVNKPGRRLYNVRGPLLQESVSVLLQVDAADGNKVVTVRSPLQVCWRLPVAFSGESVMDPTPSLTQWTPCVSDTKPLLRAIRHHEVLSL